jgi:hypothetical protein
LNEEVVDLLEIDLDTPILFAREQSDGKKTFRNLVEVRAAKMGIKIDVASGRPRYFVHGYGPDVYDLPEDELTPREVASEKALKLKELLNVQGVKGDPVVLNIGGTEWKFRFERYCRGYRCEGRSFNVAVTRNGGHITHFYDRPPVCPASLVENIDRKAALEITVPFLEDITGKPEAAIHVRDVEQVIALTTGSWEKDRPHPLEGGRTPTARLAWRIIYDTTGHDMFHVYIDSETGETLSPYFEM